MPFRDMSNFTALSEPAAEDPLMYEYLKEVRTISTLYKFALLAILCSSECLQVQH